MGGGRLVLKLVGGGRVTSKKVGGELGERREIHSQNWWEVGFQNRWDPCHTPLFYGNADCTYFILF